MNSNIEMEAIRKQLEPIVERFNNKEKEEIKKLIESIDGKLNNKEEEGIKKQLETIREKLNDKEKKELKEQLEYIDDKLNYKEKEKEKKKLEDIKNKLNGKLNHKEEDRIKKQLEAISENLNDKESYNLKIKKIKLDDIKFFFDGIRNIGICFIFFAGAIYLKENVEESKIRFLFITYSLMVSVMLFFYNSLWLYGVLSERKGNKNIFVFLVVYILIIGFAGIPFILDFL